MANGSILVVGGEIASNAAEQPTLEILPATGVPGMYHPHLFHICNCPIRLEAPN
jgi:hypothetical protein